MIWVPGSAPAGSTPGIHQRYGTIGAEIQSGRASHKSGRSRRTARHGSPVTVRAVSALWSRCASRDGTVVNAHHRNSAPNRAQAHVSSASGHASTRTTEIGPGFRTNGSLAGCR